MKRNRDIIEERTIFALNERLDRIERILDQMAARQQYHDEAIERMDGAIVRIDGAIERMSASIEKLANRQGDLESALEKLAVGQRQLLTAQVIMSDKIGELADAQKHTDKRLSALINIVMKSQSPPTM